MRAAIHDLYCLMMLYLLIEAKLDIPNGVRIIRIKEEIVLFTVYTFYGKAREFLPYAAGSSG